MQAGDKHTFKVVSSWAGDSDGDGVASYEDGRTTAYGPPTNLGGKPGRANPEELLISAIVSCYSITLAILFERRKLQVARIEVDAEGDIVRQPDMTLRFTEIRLAPHIAIAGGDEAALAVAHGLTERAEKLCPVSRAVRDTVPIIVNADITIA